jgi:hypothetical protein
MLNEISQTQKELFSLYMESQPKQNDMNEKGGASKREERERRW